MQMCVNQRRRTKVALRREVLARYRVTELSACMLGVILESPTPRKRPPANQDLGLLMLGETKF
jgi:hypothetical protein